jgi:exosortase A
MVNTPLPPAMLLPSLAGARRDWAVAGALLAFGACVLAFIFRSESAAAIQVYNSAAYNHCFLIPPVAAYLAWERRATVLATPLSPSPLTALLALPVAVAWFVAERLGIMEGRQLMAMALLQIMVASLLGLRIWRALAAPLLYLFFLVPSGEFLIPSLQIATVHFAAAGLHVLGIPNFSNGVTIQIPEATFNVAEACAGLRFLIASVAFGVIYACLMYTSPLRRVLFVGLSVIVPIIANAFRVLGITLIAHFIGNAQAVEADHVLWGWLFFTFITLALILIGLPFRQGRQPIVDAEQGPTGVEQGSTGKTEATTGRTTGASLVALVVVMLLAIAPRVSADYLDWLGAPPAVAAPLSTPALPGCTIAPVQAAVPGQPVEDDGWGVAAFQATAYQCGKDLFTLRLARFPPRIGAHELFSYLRAWTIPPDWYPVTVRILQVENGPDAPVWEVTESESSGQYRIIATALWVKGRPTTAGISARIGQALNAMHPSAVPPVIAIVTQRGEENPNDAQLAIDGFLTKTGGISELVTRWIGPRGTGDPGS